jgi:hypothetical protein
MVRGGGGRVGVSGVDVQVCSIVLLALGHCVLHFLANVLPLYLESPTGQFADAGQSNTLWVVVLHP